MNKGAIILGMTTGIVFGCYRLAPEHCGNNEGDASCPDGTFCDGCSAENNGCVAKMPSDACYFPDGFGNEVEGESSSGTSGAMSESTEDEPTTTTGSETSSTTGPIPGCVGDADCTDPLLPFCDPSGECVTCEGLSDPDGACAELDAQAPVCAGGVCVQCTTDRQGVCSGQTPVCVATNECAACTEHHECPDSACHLDGMNQGACFEPTEVTMVANAAELAAAVSNIGDGRGVIVLQGPTSYSESVNIAGDAEVAILGPSSAVLSGTSGLPIPSLNVGGNAIVYLAGPSVANGDFNGVACSGTSMWLDDSAVRNNVQLGMDVSGDCALRLRRTVVASNLGGGIDIAGGELTMRNSVVGRNGDDLTSSIGGLRLDGTATAITYSAAVGNEATNANRGSLFCLGGESGSIRNSILVGSGDSITGCDSLTFESNAVDGTALGGSNDNVGTVMAGWFIDLGINDYHLTTVGEAEFVGIASWQKGDPMTDIDGDPIPTDMASFPGYDQP